LLTLLKPVKTPFNQFSPPFHLAVFRSALQRTNKLLNKPRLEALYLLTYGTVTFPYHLKNSSFSYFFQILTKKKTAISRGLFSLNQK
jgi:hypothetical protein